MSGFFNPDNWLWKFFGKAFDFFGLSCMWLLSSMFIVTVGPASIALYDAAAHCLRRGEPNLAGRFFSTLKRELVPGILLTLVWGVIFFVLWTGFQIIGQMGLPLLKVVYYFSMAVPLGVLCWVTPIQSRFVYKFGQLHAMALRFAMAHLPATLAILALALVTLEICIRFPFFVIFLPGMLVYFQSFFVEKVFKKYMPAEEAASGEHDETEFAEQ